MNLIKLSEQLKEVPDNYLLQEVRAPQGAYPAYLIISELSRRKRMREGIAKPEPQTTVAEDLAGQSGGLAATPQAMQSTAGMDVNGQGDYEEQEMPEMAGGGLVAFQEGELVNGRPMLDQLKEDRYIDQAGYQMSVPGAMRPKGLLPYGEESRALIGNILSSAPPTPEQEEETRVAGERRFAERNPFRREEESRRIAAKEQALAGERESNVNMALMEAGLGMMGSKAARGIQGIAEGGLKGLSALRAGKQEIKKSEAYLDDAKDRYARAQELYDEKKYAAGDKEITRADERRRQALAANEAGLRAMGVARGMAKEDILTPIELEQKQRDLQLARDTYDAAVEAARLKPNDIRAQINLHNAQAEYYRAGGKGGQGGTGFASGAELKSAQEATKELLMSPQPIPGLKSEAPLIPGSKEYNAAYQRLLPVIVFQNKGKQMFMPIPGQSAPQTAAPGVIRFDESGRQVK